MVLTHSLDLSISTHTLTWSVTSFTSILNWGERISTHTLTWSVTLAQLLKYVQK